jgi:hypothetical protein
VIDLVGLAEQNPIPLARLLEEVAPGDLPVMRTLEERVVDREADRLLDIPDEASPAAIPARTAR